MLRSRLEKNRRSQIATISYSSASTRLTDSKGKARE
jgi:hypothetical protein